MGSFKDKNNKFDRNRKKSELLRMMNESKFDAGQKT